MKRIMYVRGRGKALFNLVLLLLFTIIFAANVFYSAAVSASAENISGVENDEINVDYTGTSEGYSAVLYNNSNGLPTSEANAIAETREGFIWIGSYSGLIRYDGSNFERIDSTTGITSVVCLYVDSKNRLWIGTNDNGVAVMEKGDFKIFKSELGLQSLTVRSITEDADGNIYVATTHGMSVIDNDLNASVFNETQINNEYINELRTDEASGIIYGETQNGAVFTIEDGKLSGFYEGSRLGIDGVYSILPDVNNSGYVYIGTTESKVYYGNLANGMAGAKVINIAPLKTVTSMEFIDSQLWICSDNGIGTYVNNTFIQLENLPMNNSIDQMLTDYEGNLWFSSSRQGVMKIVPNRFSDVFEKYEIDPCVVNSTNRTDNMLLIGSDNGLIAINGNGIMDSIPIKSVDSSEEEAKDADNLINLLDKKRIRSIITDSKGKIYFNTYSNLGIVVYDKGKVTTLTVDNGLPSSRVRVVYETSDGRILAACSGGLAVIKDNKVIDVYNEKSGISNPEILTVSEASNSDIVLGTDGDGIYVINNSGIKNIGLDEGLSSQVVMRIKKDKTRDIFWIVTSNSIAYMTSDYKVNTIQKFPYSNNFDVYENSKGDMWVLASNGVYVISGDELINNGDIKPVFYSMENGLPCVSTANSYSALTDDGILYIAGSTGVAKVNIDDEFDEVKNIKMAVPYVEADGEMIYPDESGVFNISSSAKRLTIYGYVYTYSLINPKVTYKLEGFDKDSTSTMRSSLEPVHYTNLKGGTYNFVMNIQDSQGNEENSIKVVINKKKAIYETSEFLFSMIILGLVMLGLFVLVIVRARTKTLLKKQNENRLFINEMIEAFAKTIDMKDRYTKGHSTRVAEYTAMLAKELGYDDETVEKYHNIALLHDIGKIGIKPEVLNKEGKLTDEEFTIIKSHSIQGYNVLKDISIMPELAIGAGAHHERPDGKGYPKGLKGDEIPRVAQIIAVADTFDAMYSDRPYRKRMNFEKAVSIIREVSGTQLTADVVDAFLRLVEKGEFRHPDDVGGGTTEDIDNIHKKYEAESK